MKSKDVLPKTFSVVALPKYDKDQQVTISPFVVAPSESELERLEEENAKTMERIKKQLRPVDPVSGDLLLGPSNGTGPAKPSAMLLGKYSDLFGPSDDELELASLIKKHSDSGLKSGEPVAFDTSKATATEDPQGVSPQVEEILSDLQEQEELLRKEQQVHAVLSKLSQCASDLQAEDLKPEKAKLLIRRARSANREAARLVRSLHSSTMMEHYVVARAAAMKALQPWLLKRLRLVRTAIHVAFEGHHEQGSEQHRALDQELDWMDAVCKEFGAPEKLQEAVRLCRSILQGLWSAPQSGDRVAEHHIFN